MPIENDESFQVIYYDVSQEYKQHYDSWLFDGSEKSKRNMKYGGQRMKTVLVYLNNVQKGRGTRFTKLNIEVTAEKGKLLVFDNVYTGTHTRLELSVMQECLLLNVKNGHLIYGLEKKVEKIV